jgi:hypothetical protein
MTRYLFLPAFLALVLFATFANAQTDPGRLLSPFDKDKDLELSATVTLFEQSHTKKTDDSFQLKQYESDGRYRFTDKFKANPAVGYSFLGLDVDSESEGVPDHLVNFSIGAASPIHQFENEWYIAGALGVGYAGEHIFDNTDAYYGKATAIVGKDFNEKSSILFALSYDGSRVIYPDIPLPAVTLTLDLHPTLELAVGFPFNTVTWRPVEEAKIEMTVLIGTVTARAQYDVGKHFQVYGYFDAISRGFRIDGLERDDRLFFDQKRLETGIVWKPGTYVGITLAGGYAFSQEFSTGFDERETDLVYKPADAAYVRAGLVWRP